MRLEGREEPFHSRAASAWLSKRLCASVFQCGEGRRQHGSQQIMPYPSCSISAIAGPRALIDFIREASVRVRARAHSA